MKTFLFRVLLLGVLSGVLSGVVMKLIPVKDSYLLAYNKKCELLEKTESPRIIFVGGSNLCFGLDSKRIADSLHVNVVNYGLHAGIGLKFMVDDIETYIRKGDIVVFAPEYSHFYTIMNGGSTTIAPLMEYAHWKKWKLLGLKQKINVIKGLPSIINDKLASLSENKRKYGMSGFNEYGDECKHWNLSAVPVSATLPMRKDFDREFGDYFINKLQAMEKVCKVVIVPPVIRKTAFDILKPQIMEVSCFLAERKYPFLVTADKHVMPDEYAYDTDYHMNKKGVDAFTSLLIDELSEVVNR